MSSKSTNKVYPFSADENKAIAEIISIAGINRQHISDLLDRYLEELYAINNPESKMLRKERIKRIREICNLVLSLIEDDSQNDKMEMPEELPLQIITEQPQPIKDEIPPTPPSKDKMPWNEINRPLGNN